MKQITKLLLIAVVLISSYSCQSKEKPTIKMALSRSVAALPFIAISMDKRSEIHWQLSFASDEELDQMRQNGQIQAAELDPVTLLREKNREKEIYGLFSMQSVYALVLGKGKNLADLKKEDVAVGENEITELLLERWLGNQSPVHRAVHGNELRAQLLRNNEVSGAVVGGEELNKLINDEFTVLKNSQSLQENVGVFAYYGPYNEVLFKKIMADYINGINLYNRDPSFYKGTYEEQTGLNLPHNIELNGRFFYDQNLFNSLMSLLKRKDPKIELRDYADLFWLPKGE